MPVSNFVVLVVVVVMVVVVVGCRWVMMGDVVVGGVCIGVVMVVC